MSATEVTPESRNANRDEANGDTGPEPGTSEHGFTGPARVIDWNALTVYERMVYVIRELPAIGKTQRNKEQGFMFRGHDDVMNALNPILAKWGVFIVPDVIERETSTRQTARGSTMYETNLHVRFTFYGAAGDSFQASGWGEGTDMGDKSTNKAMTGAFKYVVAQAFALATAETSDADADSPEETQRTHATGSRAGEAATGRTERVRHEEFDPGRNLLPGAIEVRAAADADAIRAGQRALDPSQDWDSIEEFCALHVFGNKRAELTRSETAEFWKRLTNAVVKANELAGPGDFPPPSAENITQAYAWAFKGVVLALSEPETPGEPEQAPEHDSPEAAQEATEEEE